MNQGEYGTKYTDIKATLTIGNAQLKHDGTTYKLVATAKKESICQEVTEYFITLKVAGKHKIVKLNHFT